MQKSLGTFLLCGLSVLLVGCATTDIPTENQEYLLFRDESLGLQLQRPKDWGELLSFKDAEQIIFSLPFTNASSYEIMRLHFLTYDAYTVLPEGTYQGIPNFKEKTIGYNDTYYFLLRMGEGEMQEVLSGINKETVLEYLIHTGFTISPTKETKTLIKAPERTGNQLLYTDEEHGFQMMFPKEFETMKTYTKYATTGTFDRQAYDVVIFTFPRPEKIKKDIPLNRLLPTELALYHHTMSIICIPANKYYAITDWDFGGREYLEKLTVGYNNTYYFVISMTNMARDGLKDLFPRWNEKQYKAESFCKEGGEIGIGCRLDNAFTQQFSVFDVYSQK